MLLVIEVLGRDDCGPVRSEEEEEVEEEEKEKIEEEEEEVMQVTQECFLFPRSHPNVSLSVVLRFIGALCSFLPSPCGASRLG